MRERDDVKVYRPGVTRHEPGKVHDLLSRQLSRIGEGLKVYRVEPHSSLCHHISGNRRIYAAREKEHGVSARSDGNTSGALYLPRVDIGTVLSDLCHNRDIGVFHINAQVRAGRKYRPADLRGYFGRL